LVQTPLGSKSGSNANGRPRLSTSIDGRRGRTARPMMGIHCLGRLAMHRLDRMPVPVEDQGGAGVAEDVGRNPRVDALGEHDGRRRVPKVVESNPRQSRSVEQGVELALKEVLPPRGSLQPGSRRPDGDRPMHPRPRAARRPGQIGPCAAPPRPHGHRSPDAGSETSSALDRDAAGEPLGPARDVDSARSTSTPVHRSPRSSPRRRPAVTASTYSASIRSPTAASKRRFAWSGQRHDVLLRA